jgi:transcriptional regulator with XRE-family HTH domain
MENGHREPTVAALKILSQLFGVTVDYLIDPDQDLPKEVTIQDKAAQEQLRLISQLDKDDQQFIYQMTDKVLPTKNLKPSFKKILINKKSTNSLASGFLLYFIILVSNFGCHYK